MIKKIALWISFFLTLTFPAWAIIPIHLEWDAVSGATGYVVSSRTTGGLYTSHSQTAETDQVIYVDETEPIFITIRATNAAGYSDYATEIECKLITVTIKGQGTTDWNAIQAVEAGGTHTITATPATNYKVTAMKIDGTWDDGPEMTREFAAVAADHEITIVFQKIRTAAP